MENAEQEGKVLGGGGGLEKERLRQRTCQTAGGEAGDERGGQGRSRRSSIDRRSRSSKSTPEGEADAEEAAEEGAAEESKEGEVCCWHRIIKYAL